ncbi:MAG: family permease [Pseudonocardiales bacterium]|nr:family permease [Pseudonocardiales bacterium]
MTATQETTHVGLQRSVGFYGLMFVSLGSIIGSGWLLGALHVAQVAGPSGIISWVIGAIMLSTLALIYAELGATYPVGGGTARFAYFSHGPVAGFVSGWASYLQAVFIAPVEIIASLTYLSSVHWVNQHFDMVRPSGLLNGRGLIVAILAMVGFTALNLAGAKFMAESNTGIVIWKTLVPILTIVVIGVLAFHVGNFHTSSDHGGGGGFMPFGVHGIFAALPAGVVFALQGFEQAAQLAGEAKNPKKDISRAILTAMAIGATIYLLLEVVFVGALKPSNLVHGWANPLGGSGAGDYGAWYTLALAAGATWLGTVLVVDAVISPGGTGLVYLGTTARISYALGEEREMPSALNRTDRRGVPVTSIIVAAVIGILAFGPFKSWSSIVSIVTDTTAVMYAFAPVALGALQLHDSADRVRPYRMPAPKLLLPAGFAFANLLIYWTGWDFMWKLDILIAFGFILFMIGAVVKQTDAMTKAKHAIWVGPWLVGLTLISALGRYGAWGPNDTDGHNWLSRYHEFLPAEVDLVVVIVFSVAVYYWAIGCVMEQRDVDAAIERDAHQINFIVD